MNSFQLDNFLREHTFYEKFILSKINPNDVNSLKCFIKNTYYDENIMRKFPTIDSKAIEESIIDMQKKVNNKTKFNQVDDIHFICHPRFAKTPEHHHNFIEMFYVYSGELHQTINGNNITMKQGDVCILDTKVVHSIEPASENDIIINCIMTKKHLNDILLNRLSGNDLLSSFLIHSIYQSNNYNEYILFKSGESEKLIKLMELVLCEYFDETHTSDEVINSYMVIIFSELVRVFENQTNSENLDLLKKTKITDILLYIQNNCKEATLASVAEHFHFHPNYLNKIIKKFQGNNFTSVLQEAKLKKACFLLKNSHIPVIEVASSVGYENTNFFYKLFKKYYMCTPTEYRKKISSQ